MASQYPKVPTVRSSKQKGKVVAKEQPCDLGASTNSVQPAVLVDLDPEAFRRPRRMVVIAGVAGRARHAGGPTIASQLACPRPIGVVFADPPDIMTDGALHRSDYPQGLRGLGPIDSPVPIH